MALYFALGTAINNLVNINPELTNSWFADFAKYMITFKLINMDATLIANTYLFATGKINRWELSGDMSLSKLNSNLTIVGRYRLH